jgi:hypothetical protein
MNKTITTQATEFNFSAGITFNTNEERDAFVSLFPKSVKVIGTTTSSASDPIARQPYATMQVALHADAVNGGVNETGIKRLRKFIEVASANGFELNFTQFFKNTLTVSEYNELIGKVGA